jgi:hypothetical protein
MHTKETSMRIGFGLVLFAAGCSSAPDSKLPTATFTPHLANAAATDVACGDDIALYGDTTPDLRYLYTYDGQGRITHAAGTYADGSPDDAIDYTWDGWNITHMVQAHGWGDSRTEITEAFNGVNLTSYTWDYTQADYHDAWTYAYSAFAGDYQPAREDITEAGQSAVYGYGLGYDSSGRLVSATPDDGSPSTAWTYDDAALTITSDYGNGAYTDVMTYDDQYRYLGDVWDGSDATTIAGNETYNWNGDQFVSAVYSSGSQDAPKAVQLVETDTLRYDCSMARTGAINAHSFRFHAPRKAVR